jgi:hypothetical protein
MKNKKDVILITIIIIILAIIIFSYPKPQLSPPCGDCTPWINGTCGGVGCQPLEMKQGRDCTGELPIPTEVIFEGEEFPPLLSPINPACVKRCIPMPEFCNHPPEIPFNETPEDESTEVLISTILYWNSTDPDGATITYDIYFGNETILEGISLDQEENFIELTNLDPETLYLWQIIAKDEYNETESPIWRFTTEDEVIENPPNPPHHGDDDDDEDEICTEEELDCINGSLMICENNEWAIEESCENGCQFNKCITVDESEDTITNIEISTNTNEIFETQELDFTIALEASKDQAEITLRCSLEDLDKNKISEFEETLTVNLEADLERQLPVPEILPSGEYTISCDVTYKGEIISSKKTILYTKYIQIEEPKVINLSTLFFSIVSFLLLLAIIIIFIKKKKKTKKGGKKIGNRSSKTTKATRRKHKKNSRRNKNVL